MRIGVILPVSLSDGPGQMPTWPQVRTFAQHAEAPGLHSPARHSGTRHCWRRWPRPPTRSAAAASSLGLGRAGTTRSTGRSGYPTDHRAGRFGEAIRIIGPLLRGETVTMAGAYYQVHGAVLRPPPDRAIPILVAAKGRRMLRLTARYADAWNTAWFGLPDELLHRGLADLNAALDAAGRDPATLRRTVGMEVRDPEATDPGEDLGEGFGGSVDELAWAIDAYEQLGVDDLIVQLEPKTMRSLDRLVEALELRTP